MAGGLRHRPRLHQTLPLSANPRASRAAVRAEVRGQLTVTDPATFVHILTEGMGKARSYGVGLVLVRK
ncbi:type I-E CRISPR-associated protein Cas6/Cse3/CasE [Streptomyces sp. NPDC005931]|uniref:type I-E CRISPR-associated protein Cas6/Cse3/CasE n=1 Tax=Streptomyces sp. NPDC005931 TaxID=3364737 RepID=UPI0036C796FF